VLVLPFVLHRKSEHGMSRRARFPFVGGILLLLASLISLYWGYVGIESTLHGFNLILLILSALGAFVFGFAGALMAIRRKYQAVAVFAVCAPLLANIVAVKFSLDAYQLATPWLAIYVSIAISIVGGVLISNADEQFSNNRQNHNAR
jgi:UDP-N-acetylmuramyl pentapeptide phosphotransferase/UDP-N-acetylglucosamine-1-phosphate transferase